ncbi:hypothetical protein Riv7116_6364 [Rivularia sp. PCC 7116]|uniref:hypothetical protein n=1 Tax=Rivularia sp. PCC 7116 TaxID=373994 RepID=UPI00029ECE29|nr:hypothetical protein [Rivularia sp. PCC 7116]AFY58705.1 hypothetical protein Riv7116_6364 [Rivularia sp. PCC 7116]
MEFSLSSSLYIEAFQEEAKGVSSAGKRVKPKMPKIAETTFKASFQASAAIQEPRYINTRPPVQ